MSDLDRLKAALVGALSALVRRVDYSALYEAEILTQHDDGSLDLKPVSDRLPPMSKVAIRYGIPGVTAKIKTGGHALVGFIEQDPSRPYALVVDGASIDSLALFDGDRPVARMGDAVNVFFPPVVPVSGTLSGAPFVGVMTITSSAPGQITTGNKKVTA